MILRSLFALFLVFVSCAKKTRTVDVLLMNGKKSKARVIFSHFNAQGAHNYGHASEGVRLIEEARARGVRVEAAQHVYTATHWMMTCTDGRTPKPEQKICHPRVYGAFTRKLKQFVIDEGIISMPYAIRSMTGLAADFLGVPDRGYLKEGMFADVAVFDLENIRDVASFTEPHHYSEGTVHVLVNGKFALKDSMTFFARQSASNSILCIACKLMHMS